MPGWRRVRDEPDEVVYAVEGGVITPRIVITATPRGIVMVTVVRYEHRAARAVWAVVGVAHRLVTRVLLGRGVRDSTEPSVGGHPG